MKCPMCKSEKMCVCKWISAIVIILIVVFGGYLLLQGRYQAPAPQPAPLAPKVTPAPPTQFSLTVEDQQVSGNQVLIKEVAMKDPGFAVIHLSENQKPGKVIGNSNFLTPGTYQNLSVSVSNLQEGENNFFAMVHLDNGDRVYTFVDEDLPVKVDDKVLVKPLKVIKIAQAVVREITVSGTEFSFNPSSITVSAGERVKVTFKNDGAAPHNFTITELGIATNTIGGGNIDTIEFTAPSSGTLTFFCSVSGHRQRGMEGEVSVQ